MLTFILSKMFKVFLESVKVFIKLLTYIHTGSIFFMSCTIIDSLIAVFSLNAFISPDHHWKIMMNSYLIALLFNFKLFT